jgi:hypothetical protein
MLPFVGVYENSATVIEQCWPAGPELEPEEEVDVESGW